MLDYELETILKDMEMEDDKLNDKYLIHHFIWRKSAILNPEDFDVAELIEEMEDEKEEKMKDFLVLSYFIKKYYDGNEQIWDLFVVFVPGQYWMDGMFKPENEKDVKKDQNKTKKKKERSKQRGFNPEDEPEAQHGFTYMVMNNKEDSDMVIFWCQNQAD